MADSTGENGWGLPSSAFLRSLSLPQRPDLIPPWQDPSERQRAAAEAERVRADEEETLQFIQDYVQALRDWRKEIIIRMGDHIIGRTTITLFKNQPTGGSAQPSPAQPVAGDAGTIAADLDRSSPIKLDISSAPAPAKAADPTMQASAPPSTTTDSAAVPSDGPTSAPNGGRGGTPMTDELVKESDPEENPRTALRPAAEAGTIAGPSARAAIPATVIAADGLWVPPSFLPALPSAEAILAGLAAIIGSPVTIGAAVIGGILFPTRTAADDTLDGTPFAAVPPPPNVLPGGPPVGLPALPPLAVPKQVDRGPVILPGGGPVSLPPLLPFPASRDGEGPLILSGNPAPVQLPNIVQNDRADAPNTGATGAIDNAAATTPNRGLIFVPENLGEARNAAIQAARNFEAGTEGAAVDIATQTRQVPALQFDNPNPNGAPFVKFDGFSQLDDGTIELIDAKTRLVPFSNADGPVITESVIDGLTRQSTALAQNPGFRGVLEFPTQAAANEAQDVLDQLLIRNITARVRPQ
jgi:hypothetical protein